MIFGLADGAGIIAHRFDLKPRSWHHVVAFTCRGGGRCGAFCRRAVALAHVSEIPSRPRLTVARRDCCGPRRGCVVVTRTEPARAKPPITPVLRRRRRPALPTGGSQLRCGQTAKLTALVDYKKTETRRSLWRQSEVLDGCGSDIHVVKSERLSPIEPIRRAVNAGRLDSFDDLTAKQEKLHE